ncbi:MAG: PTS sugar transporter subunit IIB [Erysipelotrichaceae bacterium]|nr:PTS sugar transporter subunit IIB [Erysipelotrichaceae bacterium]MDY6034974.1 PTS sugar transporter subunit IIB [Bulleidia sp.]
MKILLVCSQGMSSAIVAKALQEAGTKAGYELDVNECGSQAFEAEVQRGYDAALVAPQIRHRFDGLEKSAKEAGIPIALIKPQGYTPIGGPKLLEQVKELLSL